MGRGSLFIYMLSFTLPLARKKILKRKREPTEFKDTHVSLIIIISEKYNNNGKNSQKATPRRSELHD